MERPECIQKENIGTLKEAAENLKEAVQRLDKRINGTFDTIGKHIAEAPIYRSKLDVLEALVKKNKEEKLNTTKNSQWRIGIIVGIISTVGNIIMRFFGF
jgi:chromosome segregation ATPase